MLRLFLALLFAILFLLLSLPILGIEWILSKYNRRLPTSASYAWYSGLSA